MTQKDASQKIIRGVIFSYFGEDGPAPARGGWYPDEEESELGLRILHLVALKSLSLLAGETASFVSPELASVVPFPHLKMACLVYLFEIPAEKARGKRIDSCISLLFSEKFSPLIYKRIQFLTDHMQRLSKNLIEQFQKKNESELPFRDLVVEFHDDVTKFLQEYRATELNKWNLQAISEKEVDFKIKVIVLGDPGVGKTTLLLRYVDQAFRELYIPTTGVQISTRKFMVDKSAIQLNLWDLAGEKKFEDLQKVYYEGAAEGGIVLAFDICNRESFDSLDLWIKSLRDTLGKQIEGLNGAVIGNKVDIQEKREVASDEGRKLAEQYKWPYYETSAMTGENVDKVFRSLGEKVYHRIRAKLE